MKRSPQQEAAITDVRRWLRQKDSQIYRLFGYAGTGKTTLARSLAEDCNAVEFGAYTGKAAQVLTTKGCPAKTIHQLIYVPKNKSRQRLVELNEKLLELEKHSPAWIKLTAQIEKEKENLKRASFTLNHDSSIRYADLVIIDECSMVDGKMAEDLLSFGRPILVLGDPAQLPPVAGTGFFTEATPDTMLTDIHRQARDNPIIDMATRVRERQSLHVGSYGNSTVHRYRSDMAELAKEADQILCGKNKTRHAANARMRHFLGRTSDVPEAGDRLVCLRNNHNLGLLNGQIWIAAENAVQDGRTYFLNAYNEDRENDVLDLTVWAEPPEWYERTDAEEFDFGYCLTTHKAQGSQWDHVLVMDESHVFRKDSYRWLYTAITRAAERIDIVKMTDEG